MKTTYIYFVGILGVFLALLSCQDKIGEDNASGKLARMNIDGAKLLFIASENATSTLYGVKNASSLRSSSTGEEQVFEVEYYDNEGKTIKGKTPIYLKDAGDYLVALFKRTGGSSTEEVYLVRKKDGRVFEVPEDYNPSLSGNNGLFFNKSMNERTTRFNYLNSDWDFLEFQFDGAYNLYFTAVHCLASGDCPHVLHRVTPASNGELTIKPLSVENETVWGHCVDSKGNALYGLAGGEWMRYVGASGEMSERIPTVRKTYGDYPIYTCNFVWNGTEGLMALYTFTGEYDESTDTFTSFPENKYFLMTWQNGAFVKARELDLPFRNNLPSSNNMFYVDGKMLYSHYHEGVTTLVDLSSPSAYREIPTSLQANCVIGGKLHHFDRNAFSLTRIDDKDGSTTPVYTLNKSLIDGYILAYIMDVTEEGILFGAYRLSDKLVVMAKIDKENGLTILQGNSGEVSVITVLS